MKGLSFDKADYRRTKRSLVMMARV